MKSTLIWPEDIARTLDHYQLVLHIKEGVAASLLHEKPFGYFNTKIWHAQKATSRIVHFYLKNIALIF